MAQYDGSIRINTKIDTKGFENGEKEIESKSRHLAETVSKNVREIEKEIEKLKDAQKRFLEAGGAKTSPVYQEYEKEIQILQTALESLNRKQEESNIADEHWNLLRIDVEEYAKALKELQDQGKFFGDEDYDKVYLAWKNATDAVKAYQAQLIKQTEVGQAKEAEKAAKEAEKQATAQEKAAKKEAERQAKEEARIASIQAKEEARRAKEVAAIQAEEAEEQRLAQIRESAVVGNQRIIETVDRIRQLEQEIADLKAVKRTEGYVDYDSRVQELERLKQEVRDYNNGIEELKENYKKLGQVAKNALSGIGSTIKKATIYPFKHLGKEVKRAASAMLGFGKSAKRSSNVLNGSLKNILKYGLGIRSLYALVNKIRSSIKEGFSNLYKDANMTAFKNQVDGLRASLLTMKNSFAAAFRPLVETAIPYIQKTVEWINILLDKLGQFIALASGQKTYTKAIKQTADAFKDAKKAADGYLSPLDEINKYQTSKSADTGAGAGETMFEEVPVSEKFADISSWFKNMWENADFTELGSFLGQKLKNALDGIDWEQIKKASEKIGKSIGTLINGFVEVDGLGESVGKTIGKVINTGIAGINEFLDNTNWDSVGKFIGEGLNGLVNNVDFTEIGHMFAQKLNAVFITIGKAAKTFDWKNFGKNLANGFNTWISDFDWEKNGAYLGELIKGILDTLITFIEETDWQELGENLAKFIGSIDWTGIAERIAEGIGSALGGLASFIWGLIKDAWENVVNWWYDVAFEDGKFTIKGLFNGIIEVIKNIGAWIVEHIFKPFIDGFKKAFGIHSPSTVMAEMGKYLMEGLFNGISSLVDKVISIFSNIKQKVGEKWNEIKKNASEKWSEINQNVLEKWNQMKSYAKSKFTEISSNIADSWSKTKENTASAWNILKEKVVSSASNIKDNVLNAWNLLKSGTSNIWNGIVNVIRNPINTILGAVEKLANGVVNAINTVIRALNGLSFKVPDWVPLLGGNSFGFNIPELSKVSIPRLATGAVIPANSEFLAVLGDQKHGTNVEAPLDTIEEASERAILKVLSQIGAVGGNIGGTPVNLTLQVVLDRKVLGQSMIDWGKIQQMATGKNPYSLGTT